MGDLPPGIAPGGEPQTFEEHLLRVNPTRQALDNLAAVADPGPIVMLNLLRFNPRGDTSIYARYAEQAAPEVRKTGSFVAYLGRALTDLDPGLGIDDTWDGVVLPVYQRRQSFLQLQQSPYYQRAIPFRTAGTSSRLLYVLRDSEGHFSGSASIAEMNLSQRRIDAAGRLLVLDLLHFARPGDRAAYQAYAERALPLLQSVGAQPILWVDAELPIVSERPWDQVALTLFPSIEALTELFGQNQWRALRSAREALLRNSMTVVSRPVRGLLDGGFLD